MPPCIEIPVSWLRLEALAIGELAKSDASTVRAHLEKCPACAACLETIERDRRSLLPLTLAPHASVVSFDRLRAKMRNWFVGGGVLVAAAAAIALLVLRTDSSPSSTSDPNPSAIGDRNAVVAIKGGGELALSLVRMRGTVQTTEPSDFAAGDRFKVALTCSERDVVPVDVVVIQGDELFRPLGDRHSIRCGNLKRVPGAFTASGVQPITVCISPLLDGAAPLSLKKLEGAACATLIARP